MIREIRLYGDPVLREKAARVGPLDEEVQHLIDDLIETMYEADGIGLAASQVGVPLRLFVYDIRDDDIEAGVLVNPEIVERTGTVRDEEGCLSLPGLTEVVERAESIVIRGLDADGNEVEIAADGLLSRCLQHECDHLVGVLFIDRVSPLKRQLLIRKWQKRESD